MLRVAGLGNVAAFIWAIYTMDHLPGIKTRHHWLMYAFIHRFWWFIYWQRTLSKPLSVTEGKLDKLHSFCYFWPQLTRSRTVWWWLFSRGWRTVTKGTEWARWLFSDTLSTHPVSFKHAIKYVNDFFLTQTHLSRLSYLVMKRSECFAAIVI